MKTRTHYVALCAFMVGMASVAHAEDPPPTQVRIRVYDVYPAGAALPFSNSTIPELLRRYRISVTNETISSNSHGKALTNVIAFERNVSSGPMSALVPEGWGKVTFVYSLDGGKTYLPYCIDSKEYPFALDDKKVFEKDEGDPAVVLKDGLRACGSPEVPMLFMLSIEADISLALADDVLAKPFDQAAYLKALGYIAGVLDALDIELEHAAKRRDAIDKTVATLQTTLKDLGSIDDSDTDDAIKELISAQTSMKKELEKQEKVASEQQAKLTRKREKLMGPLLTAYTP